MSHEIDRHALLEVFALEASEHIALIEETLLRIERGEQEPDDIHAIFRAAHTIKGAAACLAIDTVTRFTHVLEDVVEQAVGGRVATGPAFLGLLLESVDELRRLVAGGEIDAALLARLRGLPGESAVVLPDSQKEETRQRGAGRKTLRVDVEKLDAMLTSVGELGIAKGHLGELLLRNAAGEDLLEAKRAVDRLWDELQQQLIGIRMLPIATVFKPLSRVVRDVAAKCGRAAALVTAGDDVELDLSVIEQLKDPLVHLIRNAVSHGIEDRETRIACGKDPEGTVMLCASYDAGTVLVTVRDDGRGIDRTAILARAREKGIAEAAAEELIFHPGFSTAAEVDDVSGRGIGMDVVRRNIEAIRGSVTVSSRQGEGTTFALRVPLTLAVIDGFCVAAGGEMFIMPIEGVVECLACPEVAFTGGTAVIGVRGEPLPLLRLDSLLGAHDLASGLSGRRENVVVVRHGGARAGLVVDEIQGSLQTLVRAIPSHFERNAAIHGSAILGDGRIALILDVPSLLTATAQAAAPAENGFQGVMQ